MGPGSAQQRYALQRVRDKRVADADRPPPPTAGNAV